MADPHCRWWWCSSSSLCGWMRARSSSMPLSVAFASVMAGTCRRMSSHAACDRAAPERSLSSSLAKARRFAARRWATSCCHASSSWRVRSRIAAVFLASSSSFASALPFSVGSACVRRLMASCSCCLRWSRERRKLWRLSALAWSSASASRCAAASSSRLALSTLLCSSFRLRRSDALASIASASRTMAALARFASPIFSRASLMACVRASFCASHWLTAAAWSASRRRKSLRAASRPSFIAFSCVLRPRHLDTSSLISIAGQ
mmetsp:Transcript_11130/g.34574  ORF Transcript_11130/g.34574 Transcript_11130/m.34574 type:complete len:263 (+) Transcript_11130:132-920(+)